MNHLTTFLFTLMGSLFLLSGKCSGPANTQDMPENHRFRQNPETGCDTISHAVMITNPGDDPSFQNRLFEQVPSVAATASGSCIFTAWYTGGENEGPGNFITVAVSLDSGKTWLNDQLIILPEIKTTRFFDPALWRDPVGEVHLYFASSENPENLGKYKLYDFRAGVHEMIIMWDGEKIRYSAPVRISDGIMMNSPVAVKEINSVIFPVSVWKPWIKNYKEDPNYSGDGTFVFIREYGKKEASSILKPYGMIMVSPDSIRRCDEHMIVQISSEGDMLCLIRTRADSAIYFSRSNDFGKTWHEAKPYPAVWPTTSSRFHLSVLKSGRLLLVMNDSHKRTRMTAFLSEDGGTTWPYRLLLDDREKVSYPDADQSNDGTIHIVFDHDRFGAKEILYCRITEPDILRGNTSTIFKTMINDTCR